MMRNDYRRALILLRSNEAGYSGHVRLERRTLMGSMYFVVQAPEAAGELRAALVGRNRGGYFACALEEFKRDSRGQAVLSHCFDPRDICGRELEQYQLVVVVRGECEIVLSGNVAGSAELDWAQVRAAVCGLYGGAAGSGVADETEPEPTTESAPREPEEAGGVEPEPATEPAPGEPEAEVPGTGTEGDALEAPLPESGEATQLEETTPEAAAPEPEIAEDGNPAQTAGEVLGVDMSLPWPEEIEALRALFRSEPVLEGAPDDGFVYISAPMPADSGYAMCAAGILVRDGAPAAVSYALPASYAAEPPAGLEGAAWVGDNNAGWWVTRIDLRGGAV